MKMHFIQFVLGCILFDVAHTLRRVHIALMDHKIRELSLTSNKPSKSDTTYRSPIGKNFDKVISEKWPVSKYS
ncbi:hypothetical protein AB6A40_009839 [Gnathostoma spinigerum]|uniref:Secreted protein n=1 Tax=Gnathostoma spinigerum TaxID=75299 RepID=A0ABD6F292_9BILA